MKKKGWDIMAEHNDFGKFGEKLAEQYLEDNSYEIIEKNWRFGSDEIDIIAHKNDLVIIVEVKTRRSSYFGEPEEFVTKTKQRFLIRAANNYAERKKLDSEFRFDIISVLYNSETKQINHIEDAFAPGM